MFVFDNVSKSILVYVGNKEVSATFEDGTLGFLQQDDNGQTAWLVNQVRILGQMFELVSCSNNMSFFGEE